MCIRDSRLVARRQERGAFGRGLESLSDHHRDRLVGVTDPVVLQEIEPEHERIRLLVRVVRQWRFVCGRHHLDHARMPVRGLHVEKSNAPARDAAHRQHGIEHAGWMVIGGVVRATGHLENSVTAGEGLAHVGAVPDVGRRLGERDLRHG